MWGGGAARWRPKPSPPPQEADSWGITSPHHVAEVPEDTTSRKKAQEDANGPQEGAKGTHVTSWVQGARTQLKQFRNLRK
jgi:hypothetical protein